jgi:hypothetical protein
MQPSALLAFLTLAYCVLICSFSNAFSVSSVTRARKVKGSFVPTSLFGKIPPQGDHSFDEHDDAFDVEAIRQRLESLVGGGDDARVSDDEIDFRATRKAAQAPTFLKSPAVDVVLPPAPPLTSIDRERREAEIQMLRQMEHGDDSLSDLWTLWFQERGPAAGARLLEAEELTGQGPHSWVEAEKLLRALIAEYGVYWAEPVNRLATLYYMQGRMDESETLCKMVLAVKPWHFGALSGIVMIYAGARDSQSARQWASRRLPTYAPSGPNRRRAGWVQHAVRDAMESLLAAEKRVVEAFGKPDDHTLKTKKKSAGNDDQDAWQ